MMKYIAISRIIHAATARRLREEEKAAAEQRLKEGVLSRLNPPERKERSFVGNRAVAG